MPRISGKRAFLELLRQEGVDVLFGNPGTTELPLMDAFAAGHDIRYVLDLQEAAAMAMADGYAQASQRLSVVNLPLGNAMGMLYDAQKAAAPVLVTAGQHDQGFNVTEPILLPVPAGGRSRRRGGDRPRRADPGRTPHPRRPGGGIGWSLPAAIGVKLARRSVRWWR